jgi:hypothetical protein
MSAPAGADSDDTSPVADVDPDGLLLFPLVAAVLRASLCTDSSKTLAKCAAGVPIPVDFGCVDGVVEQDDGTVRIDGSILEGGGQVMKRSVSCC